MYGIFTYIYLHLVDFHGINVGKYTIPMDPMGIDDRSRWSSSFQRSPKNSVWLHQVVGDMVEGTYYINAESKAPISSVEARGVVSKDLQRGMLG